MQKDHRSDASEDFFHHTIHFLSDLGNESFEDHPKRRLRTTGLEELDHGVLVEWLEPG